MGGSCYLYTELTYYIYSDTDISAIRMDDTGMPGKIQAANKLKDTLKTPGELKEIISFLKSASHSFSPALYPWRF